MGRIAPPAALTKKQFDSRVADLQFKGMPVTMETVDPLLDVWTKQGSNYHIIVKLAGVVFVLFLLVSIGMGLL